MSGAKIKAMLEESKVIKKFFWERKDRGWWNPVGKYLFKIKNIGTRATYTEWKTPERRHEYVQI